jgi:hypothetical protein
MGQVVSPSVYGNQLDGVLKAPVAVFWNIQKPNAQPGAGRAR